MTFCISRKQIAHFFGKSALAGSELASNLGRAASTDRLKIFK